MKLSKSKYCSAIQCNKILWLDENNCDKRELLNSNVLENGINVGELAKNLFGEYINIEYNNDLNQMVNNTKDLLKFDSVTITEASFIYNNNFCSIDILKKENDYIELYEVKSSTDIKSIYLDDIAFQANILINLGYNIRKAAIVYINSKYVRKGDLNLNELFIIRDVTQEVFNKQEYVTNKIAEINRFVKSKDEPVVKLGIHCVTPYNCPYFRYCSRSLPSNNIFNIKGMKNSIKFNLYNKNIITYENLLKADIDDRFKEQIEFEISNRRPKVNKTNIKNFLDKLDYPLYFLDFETFQQAIPMYDDISPYMQIPFQYSLHIKKSTNSEIIHKEFLAETGIDPRRALAQKLVKDIPKNTCVIAYNMSFEKSVIKGLAKLFPDLSDHLMNIHKNIVDLMIPFKNRDYYVKEMHGSYSIKYVLPALFPDDEELNYQKLELIHNGNEAMNSFANLSNLSKKEQRYVRQRLLKYCELDTYAMVKIWQKLKETCQ